MDTAVMDHVDRRTVMIMGARAVVASAILGAEGRALARPIQPITELTLADASSRLQRREITSLTLTKAFLDQIAAVNGPLNAFITVMTTSALARARLLDAEMQAGQTRGPLHGLPIVLKDNIDTQGTRTTAGSQIYDDRVPDSDAFVVQLLLQAGVVILGKANMHEFAFGRTSTASYYGPVHNPWALDRVPAGSSGGCAVAVIADMCLAALGTDTGGSCRMPAAYCSMVGLKPTYGLVSTRGIVPLVYSMDHCGPMAKTTEDAALLLNAMVAYDKLDIASVDHPREDYLRSLKQPVAPFRLGIPRAPFFDKLDPQIDAAVAAAIDVLRGRVADVRDVTLPATNALDLSQGSPLNAEMITFHHEMLRSRSAGYSISIRRRLQEKLRELDNVTSEPASEKISDYIKGNWDLIRARKLIDDSFENIDLLVLPTMRVLPPLIADVIARDETMTPQPQQPVRDNNCSAFNIWGIPAVSIPCGFSREGLPIGLMIAGPRFSEGRVLALAHAYEQATKWHLRRPSLRGSVASGRQTRIP